jgi:hypothetical protein
LSTLYVIARRALFDLFEGTFGDFVGCIDDIADEAFTFKDGDYDADEEDDGLLYMVRKLQREILLPLLEAKEAAARKNADKGKKKRFGKGKR